MTSSEVWKNWCRLCAKDNGCQVDVFVKNEEVSNLQTEISKYFGVTISPCDVTPTMICHLCHKFVTHLVTFAERSSKVQNMFNELQFNNKTDSTVADIDLCGLRERFGLAYVNTINATEIGKDEEEIALDEVEYCGADYLDITKIKEEQNVEMVEVTPDNDFDHADPDDNDKDVEYNSDQATDSDDSSIEVKKTRSRSRKSASIKATTSSASSRIIKRPKIKKEKQEESSADYKYNCEQCPKAFKREQHFRLHMKNIHEVVIKPSEFPCTKCDKIFSTLKRLENHEYSHLPLEMKLNNPCPYCDKLFTKQVNVKMHIQTVHQNEKPYICEECGKAVKTIGALKEHKYIHMEECPYACPHCDKRFKTKARLKTHVDTHNDTIYVCTICGLQLNTRRTLKMHMLVHSDQKRHKCSFCGNEFKRAKALKNHLILHTGLKPYTCNFCDKTFANGSNCRSHKKKSHPEELAAMEAAGAKSTVQNMPKLEQLRAVAALKKPELSIDNDGKPIVSAELLPATQSETSDGNEIQHLNEQHSVFSHPIFESFPMIARLPFAVPSSHHTQDSPQTGPISHQNIENHPSPADQDHNNF